MTKLKMTLLALSLVLSGCESLPEAPDLWQCGYSIKFNKFRCVNTKTKQAVNLSRDNPGMEAAQCLSLDDYRRSEEWVDTLIKIAKERCR